MMQVYFPRPPLDRYIDCLWHVDLRMTTRREKILPSPRLELIINFGAPFLLERQAAPNTPQTCTDAWLVGLQTGPLVNEPLAETHMIGVRFRPGGQQPFFRLPASDFTDRVAPLDALWGAFAAEARERLAALRTVHERFRLLEALLRQRFTPPPRALPHIDAAITAISRHDGALSIRALAYQLGVSHKHLVTQFRDAVGLSPKALARTYRLQALLQTIDPSAPVDWARVAQDAQFYDQSHFNHEFSAFTGLSPGEYLRLRQEVYGAALQPGEDVHFVPLG